MSDVIVSVDELPGAVLQVDQFDVLVQVSADAVIVVRELSSQTALQVTEMAALVQVEVDVPASVVEVQASVTQVEVDPSPEVVVQVQSFSSGSSEDAPRSLDVVSASAASDLGGHRVVRALGDGTVEYASSADVAHASTVLGITTGATSGGDVPSIRVAGEMTDPSFAFAPGPIYFNGSGVLTQTRPVAGFVQQVATAVSATKIVIDLGVPIILN